MGSRFVLAAISLLALAGCGSSTNQRLPLACPKPGILAEGADLTRYRAGKVRDLTSPERLVIAPLIILIVVLGVFPKPFLDRMTPSVERTLDYITLATCPPHHTCLPTSAGQHVGVINQGGGK